MLRTIFKSWARSLTLSWSCLLRNGWSCAQTADVWRCNFRDNRFVHTYSIHIYSMTAINWFSQRPSSLDSMPIWVACVASVHKTHQSLRKSVIIVQWTVGFNKFSDQFFSPSLHSWETVALRSYTVAILVATGLLKMQVGGLPYLDHLSILRDLCPCIK